MHIIAVDEPTEEWQSVVAAAAAPGEPVPDVAQLLAPREGSRRLLWAATGPSGEIRGVAHLWLPADPDRSGEVDIHVRPEHRRQGVGTALLAAAADGLRAGGCKTVIAQVFAETPAAAFLTACGFECVLNTRAMLLRLADVDWARLSALVAEGRPGYRLTRWTGTVPDELTAELANAKTAMADIARDEFRWDAERVRGMARAVAERGDELYTVAALYGPAAAPRIAGFTEVVVSAAVPERAAQYDTAVVPEHRGRRLGIWVKAAMLEWLRARHPEIREIETDNTDDNSHMLAVNQELGFRRERDYLDYQAEVANLPATA